jgi:HAD superfamily hydrolase (TIGR01450 family)
MKTLAAQHDCLLIDLDGTVFRGDEPINGAVDSLQRVQTAKLFVTNNASRSAAEVAAQLNRLGFVAAADDVVTSAQTAAHLLAQQLSRGSPVLVVGTEALAAEIGAVGLRPVRRYDEQPVAVVQGHCVDTGWADLAEAALAIRVGPLWMATNVDRTLPSERGLLPGNGAMVAALRAATDAEPRIAGKPSPALVAEALARGDFQAPLVVGDRLDTDIAGANAAGLPSLLVLTGASSVRDTVDAVPEQRPAYIAADLRSLHDDAETLAVGAQPDWQVHISGATVTVEAGRAGADGEGLSVVRALAHAVWDADLGGRSFSVEPGDDTAREALQHWSLLADSDHAV